MPAKRPELKEVKKPEKKTSTTELKVPKRKRPQTVRCIAYPNRTRLRLWTPKKVGDVVCHMLSTPHHQIAGPKGSSQTALANLKLELRRELNRCFPCEEGENEQLKKLREAAAQAVAALQENSTLIVIALAVLAALLPVGRLLRFIPGAARIGGATGAEIAAERIPAIMARLQSRQAANDSLWRLIVGL